MVVEFSMGKSHREIRTGSCLCGRVRFAVSGDVEGVGRCLCSQCRKVSGTNGNAVFIVPNERFEWLEGESNTTEFSLPSGWSVLRCRECGSPLPQSHDGKQMWVTAGLMDADLGASVGLKIYVGSRADWDRDAPSLLEFEELPGSQ